MAFGPFKSGGVEIREDDGTDFVRVGYGYIDGTATERWWLYKTAPEYTEPGVAEPGLVARFIPLGGWSLSGWLTKATTSHPITGGSHSDGHPHDPGLMHNGNTDHDYMKGNRVILTTLESKASKVRDQIPSFMKPDDCDGTIWSQVDGGFLRIRPVGSTTLTLGYVFVETTSPKTNGVRDTVEYWLLFDDDDFWDKTAGEFDLVQVEDEPGSDQTTFNATVYNLFAAQWSAGVSSLTIVAMRTYSCSEVDPL